MVKKNSKDDFMVRSTQKMIFSKYPIQIVILVVIMFFF